MNNKTITFVCEECGQELTFYRDTFVYDGAHCPICDVLGYKPMLKQFSENIRGSEEVKVTREIYKKKSKNSPKILIEDIFGSKFWY